MRAESRAALEGLVAQVAAVLFLAAFLAFGRALGQVADWLDVVTMAVAVAVLVGVVVVARALAVAVVMGMGVARLQHLGPQRRQRGAGAQQSRQTALLQNLAVAGRQQLLDHGRRSQTRSWVALSAAR